VSDGRDHIATAWWLTVLPGAVIVCVVLAITRLARVIGVDR
jgi:peptide/nickel transport system permease protein